MSDNFIRLTGASVDRVKGKPTAIHGYPDPTSLGNLTIPEYQREILGADKIRKLMVGLADGRVPDITLGLRGSENFEMHDGTCVIKDPTYIIDGLQRRTAALRLAETGIDPHLGATVLCNTDIRYELKEFRDLNAERTRVGASLLLRNEQTENESVAMLVALTEDPGFALFNRVSWTQRMKPGELINGVTLEKAAGALHSGIKRGMLEQDWQILAWNLDLMMGSVGRIVVRTNIENFWKLIDEVWGIKRIAHRNHSPQLAQMFVVVLGRIFADHVDFWAGNRFKVNNDIKAKLALFPIDSDEVASYCSGHGAARVVLYEMIVRHINSGRRTNRLTPRISEEEEEEENGGE